MQAKTCAELNLSADIEKILLGYVSAKSFSNSKGEKDAEKYFVDYFANQPYFQSNPRLFGAYPIEGDYLDRSVVWAMVKGSSPETIVMIHHYDVVTVEDYKLLKDFAFKPYELEGELKKIKEHLSDEARSDLESGDYLFGRGVCDMKGGGSIQMALLSQYAEDESFKGNVIVMGVPDEENLSAGMRGGILLLNKLKEEYNLDYKLMINSEPHQRKDKDRGVFSLGSIGKIMPYVYVRGFLAHAGKVFEGLNPVNIMSEIVRNTEVNMKLSDVVGKEAAPPPTWLYLRENKISYDVSMPLTITGCLSILTLNQTPKGVMDEIKDICKDSFKTVLDDMNKNYHTFLECTCQEKKDLPWKVKVVDFGELYNEAYSEYGEEFKEKYDEHIHEIKRSLELEEETLITTNFKLVDFVFDYVKDLSPRVVVGLIPPYYPNVANLYMDNLDETVSNLYDTLNNFTKDTFSQEYDSEYFYTGISDLSYANINDGEAVYKALKESMPLLDSIYKLPVKDIEAISMPCINIGPWGKDFHKLTERVLKEDLLERTPRILDYAVKQILK